MISIVCVYNDQDKLDSLLLASLKVQTTHFEIEAIDNRQGTFPSAAAALNYGGRLATGKYIMFVHQDIVLGSETWLADTEKWLDSIPDLGVAGVAGREMNARYNTASVTHGVPAKFVGRQHLSRPTQVQTLDECLIIVPRHLFARLEFDGKTCDDWHLYAVNYCLDAKTLGYDNYVVPTSTYHASLGRNTKSVLQILLKLGSLPEGYVTTAKKVLKKHQNSYKRIHTVCGTWNTSWPFIWQRIINIPKDLARHLYWRYRQRKHKGQY